MNGHLQVITKFYLISWTQENTLFKIKARNQKGVMGEEYKVTFTIKPPLWKSKGAIISYIVMIIMLVCYNSTKKLKD